MADVADVAILDCTQGEDYIAQFVWSGDDGDLIPISAPVKAQARDGDGQIVLNFSTSPDDDINTVEKISTIPDTGFFQLTIPGTKLKSLTPGRYVFDMFAGVEDPGSPFTGPQKVKVLDGYIDVKRATTDLTV